MAEQTDSNDPFHRLFEQIEEHVETRWELFALTAAERAAEVAASVTGAVVVFVFGVLVLFFFSMGLGWWLGDLTGSRAGGFALAGLVFVPVGLVVYHVARRAVRERIAREALRRTPPPDENKPADG